MKHADLFDAFLVDTVNLNATRVASLEESVDWIKTFLDGSDYGAEILGFAEQGSWAHQTIIRPVGSREFDADLVMYVAAKPGWEAKDYVNYLYDVFKASGRYADKVKRYSHCATIEYAGDKRIDIAPCVVNRVYLGFEVCNRTTNTFEASAPGDYTNWIIGKNTTTGGNRFRKVTRLVKYLKDVKTTFTCPSFLLTTLLGQQVYSWDATLGTFPDVPTTLKVLIGRLDDFLQANLYTPEILNPVLASEVQSNVWDQAKYENFREKINTYRGWIDDAFSEQDRGESIAKWRRVFPDFAATVVIREAADIGNSAVAMLKSSGQSIATAGLAVDLVDLVKRIGQRALPPTFSKLSWMEQPRWKREPGTNMVPRVTATLHAFEHGPSLGSVQSLQSLQAGLWLKFSATTSVGTPYSSDYTVKWRITNTDRAAAAREELRGGFYPSSAGAIRWEGLAYHGVHVVEAFLLRNNRLVGQSPPFYVVVD